MTKVIEHLGRSATAYKVAKSGVDRKYVGMQSSSEGQLVGAGGNKSGKEASQVYKYGEKSPCELTLSRPFANGSTNAS